MTDLADLRAALAANLAAIPGLQESPYLLGNPTPPAAEIEPGKIDYDKAMQRGLDVWRFTVRVFVGLSSDLGAQKRLDTFFASTGESSVKAALESDPTLGGHADDLHVSGCSGYKVFIREIAGSSGRGSVSGPLLGAEWTVEVLAAGT